ncbi:hypothetical protein C8Q76DRAFT_65819 [Earliella scabrosa]|nr:hypothetical protein C8Q76DRAFT_65819 [Earliella scabrosa]
MSAFKPKRNTSDYQVAPYRKGSLGQKARYVAYVACLRTTAEIRDTSSPRRGPRRSYMATTSCRARHHTLPRLCLSGATLRTVDADQLRRQSRRQPRGRLLGRHGVCTLGNLQRPTQIRAGNGEAHGRRAGAAPTTVRAPTPASTGPTGAGGAPFRHGDGAQKRSASASLAQEGNVLGRTSGMMTGSGNIWARGQPRRRRTSSLSSTRPETGAAGGCKRERLGRTGRADGGSAHGDGRTEQVSGTYLRRIGRYTLAGGELGREPDSHRVSFGEEERRYPTMPLDSDT